MKTASQSYRNIRTLLVAELSPQQASVLNCVAAFAAVDSEEVSDQMGVSVQHASTLLKDLWHLGLLDRHEVIDDEGRHYVYQVNQ